MNSDIAQILIKPSPGGGGNSPIKDFKNGSYVNLHNETNSFSLTKSNKRNAKRQVSSTNKGGENSNQVISVNPI